MNEHEPECWCRGCTHPHVCGRCRNCICDELRACERRVLDAARDAVETVWADDPSWDGTNWNNALYDAIAAIDALREKP